MKIKSIKEITPVESNCISVDSHDKLFAVGEKGNLLTHNSVSQQNIIISCLLRPEHWVILGIDLKRVELTRFKKFGVKVATDLETAVEFLRFAQAVMMKRYERMEELEVNDFEDLPENLQALMVMIDEAGELLSPSGSKALSEFTKIPMADGSFKTMGELKIGDYVLDNYSLPTKIIDKYEPDKQERYNVTIKSDKTNEKDTFIAGEDHLWVTYIANPDNSVEGPYLMETSELNQVLNEEKAKPASERRRLKFKRHKKQTQEII